MGPTARLATASALSALLAAAVIAIPASAGSPVKTKLISKTSNGDPATGDDSFNPSISASGRVIAFASGATNLPGANGEQQIYAHDRKTGKTKLVSKRSNGNPASDGNSFVPSISASGRFVAFQSNASSLPGPGGQMNVYVHDRDSGETKLVSRTSGGEPADGNSTDVAISGSGRFVAFESVADNLPGDNGVENVYVHDRKTGKTKLVSRTSGGGPATGGNSAGAAISPPGRFVAFQSFATNLPGNPSDAGIYVHDRKTDKTKLVSRTSGGDPVSGIRASLSASGGLVAFSSDDDSLPGSDLAQEIYVHDRETGTTRLVSKTSAGEFLEDDSDAPRLSAKSGRFVAFQSNADNLPGADGFSNVYVHDRKTGKTKLLSQTSGGEPADAFSITAAISATGRFVTFQSAAANLPGDPGVGDIFVRGPLP